MFHTSPTVSFCFRKRDEILWMLWLKEIVTEGIVSWFFIYCLWAPEDIYLMPLWSKDLLPILPWQDEVPGWFSLPCLYLAHLLAAEQIPYSSHVWLLLPYWRTKSVVWRCGSITIASTIGSLDLPRYRKRTCVLHKYDNCTDKLLLLRQLGMRLLTCIVAARGI